MDGKVTCWPAGQGMPMDRELTAAWNRLKTEFKKDVQFFGFCGVLVGIFLLWQSKAKQQGWSRANWASDLLGDFMSFNAFGLVFFAYLAIGCTATVLSSFGMAPSWLLKGLDHVEDRLTQFASALIAFMAGLLSLVAIASLLNLDLGGLKVFLLALLFCALVAVTYITGNMVARRAEPFDRWWVALLSLVICLSVLVWLVFFSPAKASKQTSQAEPASTFGAVQVLRQ